MTKKFIVMVMLTVITFIGTGLYVFRDFISWPKKPVEEERIEGSLYISQKTKDYIEKIVNRTANIVALRITSVDFPKNIRVETYTSISDTAVELLYSNYIENKLADIPVFGDDPQSTKRVLQLINGDFICVDVTDTLAYKLVPKIAEHTYTVCALGISVYSTEMSGIITLFLEVPPYSLEQEHLFLFAREVAFLVASDNKEL